MMSKRKPSVLLIGCGTRRTSELLIPIELFQKKGWNVRVVMTSNGRKFAEAAGIIEEMERRIGSRVVSEYNFPRPSKNGESKPSFARSDIRVRDFDAVVIAPATMNFIGTVHAGIQSELASGLTIDAIGAGVPVVMVPFTNSDHRNSTLRLHDET